MSSYINTGRPLVSPRIGRKNDYREDEKFDNKNLNKYNDFLEKAIKYVKRKNQIDNIYKYLINNIEKIDFLLNICYDKEIINQKRYFKFGEKIDEVYYTIK